MEAVAGDEEREDWAMGSAEAGWPQTDWSNLLWKGKKVGHTGDLFVAEV